MAVAVIAGVVVAVVVGVVVAVDVPTELMQNSDECRDVHSLIVSTDESACFPQTRDPKACIAQMHPISVTELQSVRVFIETYEEGREKGRASTMISAILKAGTKRFGVAPTTVGKQLSKLKAGSLDEVFDFLLDAPDWKSVAAFVKTKI